MAPDFVLEGGRDRIRVCDDSSWVGSLKPFRDYAAGPGEGRLRRLILPLQRIDYFVGIRGSRPELLSLRRGELGIGRLEWRVCWRNWYRRGT